MGYEELDEIFSEIDLFKGIENYMNLYINTLPKKVNRKIRFNFKGGKFKYRHGISKNLLHDFMLPPSIVLKPLLRRL